MTKKRIDVLLVERGLAESRNRAQQLVKTGKVQVNGEVVEKSSIQVPGEAEIVVLQELEFVSRGGHKLAAAVDVFNVQVTGKVCADVGASTGGFTDCLLQNGAEKVYAIDVGVDLLHRSLRDDPRVILMEGTNARYLINLPESVDLVTVDASFISLKLILPVVKGWFGASGGQVIALIKPQFEAGPRAAAAHAGVIKDRHIHRSVLDKVISDVIDMGYYPAGLIPSPIRGPKGNVEFLVDLRLQPHSGAVDVAKMIGNALQPGLY